MVHLGQILRKDFQKFKYVYIMAIPMLLYYILFCYAPMYGTIIAFKNFTPALGIQGSPWAGLKYFHNFFHDINFTRILTNTISISLKTLVIGFPAPILLAIMLNEVKTTWFKRTVQTVSYLPHFISIMVVAGLIRDFTASQGAINVFLSFFGFEPKTMLLESELFQPIYVLSDIWQGIGWGSIIYFGALTGIDPQLYEAADMDGAGRFRKIIHITFPGILPTIIIMLLLNMGSIMDIGYEKIILLYNSSIYETSDVISTYVYRKGLLEFNFSYSAAVGLFNSAINFLFIISANWMSRKITDTSLW